MDKELAKHLKALEVPLEAFTEALDIIVGEKKKRKLKREYVISGQYVLIGEKKSIPLDPDSLIAKELEEIRSFAHPLGFGVYAFLSVKDALNKRYKANVSNDLVAEILSGLCSEGKLQTMKTPLNKYLYKYYEKVTNTDPIASVSSYLYSPDR